MLLGSLYVPDCLSEDLNDMQGSPFLLLALGVVVESLQWKCLWWGIYEDANKF